MARKNMFEGITPAAPRPEEPRPAPRMPEVFQSAGPIAAIRNDLRSVGARSVQEIDPGLIEDTGLKDRLGEPDVGELRDSIARHGQQVPILLRPHPTLSGRYQVVYGRRRLAAIKGLGVPVKALIRTLSDEEAVLAQGQENNVRKDPSFIEKALFAGELEAAGYDARVVQDALNVNRSHTSHMRKVREAFPRAVIERIGAAPSIGWKRWYELAGLVQDRGIDASAVHAEPFAAHMTSDQRFAAWVKALEAELPAPEKPVTSRAVVTGADGARIGSAVVKDGKLTFQAEDAGFARWLEENAAAILRRLHDDYLAG